MTETAEPRDDDAPGPAPDPPPATVDGDTDPTAPAPDQAAEPAGSNGTTDTDATPAAGAAGGGDGADAAGPEGGEPTGDDRAATTAGARRPGVRRPGIRRLRGWLAAEGLLTLEVMALTSFAIARPLFDTFGRSTEALLARDAGRLDVVLFGLAVLAGPALVATAVVAVTRAAGDRARRLAHVAVLGLAGVLAARELADQMLSSASVALLWALGVVGGLAVAAARLRWASVASFLRLAGAISAVFLLQFLVLSPASALVMGGRSGGASDESVAAVAAGAGDDAPPVVMVVLDGLPTEMMLDGRGRIDAEVFPHLAELAGDATWYRNHTTVAPVTLRAVPAMLSGSMPGDGQPVTGSYPNNLFTLLGGSYDFHVEEQITGLCPEGLCPASGDLGALAGDAAAEWRRAVSHEELENGLPQALDRQRVAGFDEWIDGTDFADDGGDPNLYFYHHLLPHDPWDFLPDGSTYDASVRPSGIFLGSWGDWGYQVAQQRHLLQAQSADRSLGRLLDRLRDAGTYDESLVVVTSDHGWGFTANQPLRGPTDQNADDVLWTPLLVKEPGQTGGRVDDANMAAIDVLPTIADALGVDLPFAVDGLPPDRAAERDPRDKEVYGWADGAGDDNPESGIVYERRQVDGRAGFRRVLEGDAVAGEGARAVWQLDDRYGPLVGTEAGELGRGDPVPDAAAEVEELDRWDDVDPDDPPLEVVGNAPVPADATVAVTVNGTVAAVVPTAPSPYGVSVIHALLWPGALREGSNEIGVALVEGTRERPVLRPLDVRPKP